MADLLDSLQALPPEEFEQQIHPQDLFENLSDESTIRRHVLDILDACHEMVTRMQLLPIYIQLFCAGPAYFLKIFAPLARVDEA